MPVLVAAAVLAALAAGLSIWRGWRRGVFTGLLVSGFLLPPVTVFVQAEMMEFTLFPWYIAWQTPLVIVVFASGLGALAATAARPLPKGAAAAAGAVALLLLAVATGDVRRLYLEVPVEPARESAAAMRESPNPYAPGHGEVLTLSLISPNHLYDPWNYRLRNVGEMRAMMARADAAGLALYCETARLEAARARYPECAALLLDSGAFELVRAFGGHAPAHTRSVFRYRPGSLAGVGRAAGEGE